jgi:carboxypeptidase C (cathepsin A)
MRSLTLALMLALGIGTCPAWAQDKAPEPKADVKPKPAGPEIPPPQLSVTRHSGVFGGVRMNYVATAGDTYLTAADGTPRASITSYSYVKEPRDPSRPVTFLFNGGPGSGSVWLHMGAFGPKRVAIPSDARDDGAPPYPLVDNPDSLLDVTDIVFIDPVGTGFSHALGKTEAKEFWGVNKDAESVAEFIRLWLNRNGRWNSPKFLGGESYGTTRSAAVLNQLEGQYNDVALNGVILISTILDFGATAEMPGNEMSYVLNLPSMAVAALFHRKLQFDGTTAQFAEEARRWAIGPYAAALLKGNALSTDERTAIRRDLARYTGLTETYLESADLRVTPGRFYKELLRDRGLTIGRLDARYTGKDFDNAGEGPDDDPSFYGIDGGYTAAINAYVRSDLNYQTDRRYVTIGSVQPWDWRLGIDSTRDAYLNVAPYIGTALRKNSGLRIFVGQGWYDFATPFFPAEYALSRTGYPKDRIQFHYYDAGHMMYVNDVDREKLSRDIRGFIRSR